MIEVECKEDLDAVLEKNEKALVLFYASWCPHCSAFVPKFERAIVDFKGATLIYVLLDDYDNPLWDDFDVEAVPTVIFFENGKVSSRLDGKPGSGLNDRQLKDWMEKTKLA